LETALVCGIPEQTFWELTPRKFKIYVNASRELQRERDTEAWVNGMYTLRALQVALDQAFSGRKSTTKYFEAPILKLQANGGSKYEDASDWPEEKKEEYRKRFLGKLQTMEKKFNDSRAKK
jgi:hypothetical protein